MEDNMKQKINTVILTTSDHKQVEINNVLRSGVVKSSRVYMVEYTDESGFNRLFAPLEAVFMIEEFVAQNEEKEEKKEKRTSLQDFNDDDDDGNDDTVVVDDDENDDDINDDDEGRDAEDDTDNEDVEEDDDEEEYDDDVEKIRKKRTNK